MSFDIIKVLESVGGVIIDDHFVLKSGKHASKYINKDALYPHTDLTSQACIAFVDKTQDLDYDVVVGPALGGIILSQWTAWHASKQGGKEIYGVYTEKNKDEDQIFTRGYDKFVNGKKVLIVEDVTSTGGSAKSVLDAVRLAGGEVVGVVVLVNRNPSEVTSEYFGVPFYALGEFIVEVYEESNCPMCKESIPVNQQIGHGRKYMEAKNVN
ncbi:hypothetical protein A3F37_02945 [Candidatus Saccharibacteria bacterium RIFCSPHIGHO2_12_FULL_41_12]|nr:MAG: hypothetical protein A3F37_02945 [Candidatus Saccharibacteria bacterium RIFCSPHIGHO2_12_FULL_41_12]